MEANYPNELAPIDPHKFPPLHDDGTFDWAQFETDSQLLVEQEQYDAEHGEQAHPPVYLTFVDAPF